MPMPKPKPREARNEFVQRFISNDLMRREYPDVKQRIAVAHSQYDKKKTTDDGHEVLMEGDLYDAVQEAVIEIPEGEDTIVDEVFISDEGVSTREELLQEILRNSMRGLNSSQIHKERDNIPQMDIAKSIEGSTQSREELRHSDNLGHVKVVEPPYPPEVLSQFLEVDETHFRCVRTKVTDAVSRDYYFEPIVSVQPEVLTEPQNPIAKLKNQNGSSKANSPVNLLQGKQQQEIKGNGKPQTVYTQSEIDEEIEIIKTFIESCNEVISFEGVLERAAMDYEAIGWAALEVIRGQDMKVRKLAHAPAERIRPLRGWKGFVELESTGDIAGSKFTYYQAFGNKVLSAKRKSPDGSYLPYDPKLDGELNGRNAQWRMVDKKTGEPTTSFKKSANEILWVPKHHSNTVYFGLTDVIPALGGLFGNIHVRDYMLQFFDHNTIPRYAIIVEGARLAPKVVEQISKYFSEHIKGKHHKTLIIPVPSIRGEVKLRFEKLDTEAPNVGHSETKKDNSQSIMTAHGVSPAIIGIAEHSELGSGKGLSQAEIYKDRIVTPSQKTWARNLNLIFRLGLGLRLVKLRFTPLDIRDKKAEQEILTGYLDKGVYSINEVRKRLGLETIPGGDRPFILVQNQVVFIDDLNNMAGMDELKSEIDSLRDEMNARDTESALDFELESVNR